MSPLPFPSNAETVGRRVSVSVTPSAVKFAYDRDEDSTIISELFIPKDDDDEDEDEVLPSKPLESAIDSPSVVVKLPSSSSSPSAELLHDPLFRRDYATKQTASKLRSLFVAKKKTATAEQQQMEMENRLLAASNASLEEAISSLGSTANGISPTERTTRLLKFGRNEILFNSAPTWYKQLLQAMSHPFNFLLCGLAIISAATGDFVDMAIMLIIVTLSVMVRFYQERKAVISAESLKKRITHKVNVRVPIVKERTNLSSQTPLLPEGDPNCSSADMKTVEMTSSLPQLNGDFTLQSIDFNEIVPGDVIHFSAGDLVPCDARVIQSTHLHCNQTVLTGESLPVEKDARRFGEKANDDEDGEEKEKDGGDAAASYLRRSNLCFNGAIVSSGAGVIVAVTTGNATYFGFNAGQLILPRAPSAFAVGVRKVSYMLLGFMAVMVPSVLIISGVVSGDWESAALFATAAAVGLTPEMLPMIVNSNLAIGAFKMSKEKCLVKRLEAIQNIGAIDVLCSDKTGTLTNDHVQLYSTIGPLGEGSDATVKVTSDGHSEGAASMTPTGDEPTSSKWTRECAFLIASNQEGFRNVLDNAILGAATQYPALGAIPPLYRKVNELPFDFNRKRMSVIVEELSNHKFFLFCKGAQEQTCKQCSSLKDEVTGQVRPITAEDRTIISNLGRALASRGLRVLAVAGKEMTDSSARGASVGNEVDLTLYGFLTFLDIPKADAAPALKNLASLHVRVKVLTGDNPLIAKQVCKELGLDINDQTVMTSDQLHQLPYLDEDKELIEIFERVVLFAGLNPDDKARVVRVLRLASHVVGFLGDGLNDAMALKESDVGISVDSGSDLAKDAADMILTEKSLHVLEMAVRLGRITHGNTIKYIKMAASSNFGNVFSLMFAAGFLPFIPMQPQQILLQNLLYDFSQTAIPFDTMDPEYIDNPKTWSATDLARFMCIGPVSSIFDVCTFMLGTYYYGWTNPNNDDQYHLQTTWFVEGLLTQVLIVHMIRTEKMPFFQSTADWRLLLATTLCAAIGLIIPNIPPIASALQMYAPPGDYYGFLTLFILGYAFLIYITKKLYIRRFKMWL